MPRIVKKVIPAREIAVSLTSLSILWVAVSRKKSRCEDSADEAIRNVFNQTRLGGRRAIKISTEQRSLNQLPWVTIHIGVSNLHFSSEQRDGNSQDRPLTGDVIARVHRSSYPRLDLSPTIICTCTLSAFLFFLASVRVLQINVKRRHHFFSLYSIQEVITPR